MKPRSLSLTLVFGLAVGLFACQDGGVIAPDDLHPQFAKVDKCDPWPTCKGGDDDPTPTTAVVEFGMGLSSIPYSDEEINTDLSDDGLFFLKDGGPSVQLGPFDIGECQTIYLSTDANEVALLAELWMLSAPGDPGYPDYSDMGTGVYVDKDNLGFASEENWITLNYISEELGLINLRIGGVMFFDTGYSTVDKATAGNVDTYTFSGGSVIVKARAYRKRGKTPRLQCVLPTTAHSTVTVTWPSGP